MNTSFHTEKHPGCSVAWMGWADNRLAPCPMCGYSTRVYTRRDKLDDGTSRVEYRVQCPDGHEPVEPVYTITGRAPRSHTDRDTTIAIEHYNALAAAYDGPKAAHVRDWRDRLGDGEPNDCPVCGREPLWRNGWFGCPDHPWVLGREDPSYAVREWNKACDLLDELQGRNVCPLCHTPVGFGLSERDESVTVACGCTQGRGGGWRAAAYDWLARVDGKRDSAARLAEYRHRMRPVLDGLCAWWDGLPPRDPVAARLRAAGFDDAQTARILSVLESK